MGMCKRKHIVPRMMRYRLRGPRRLYRGYENRVRHLHRGNAKAQRRSMGWVLVARELKVETVAELFERVGDEM